MNKTACLIIHGFGGSPAETDFLTQYLSARGFDSFTLLLPGHGGTKKNLKNTSHADWISSVELMISSLKREYSRIVLLGFSMGGLISIYLANIPSVERIVLINTPVSVWNIKIILKDIASGIMNGKPDKLKHYIDSVKRSSFKSNMDFLRLMFTVKKKIETVKRPAMIIQCMNDETAHYKSAKYIKKKMGGYAVLHYYEGGCHQVFLKSPELRDLICDEIYGFLNSVIPPYDRQNAGGS